MANLYTDQRMREPHLTGSRTVMYEIKSLLLTLLFVVLQLLMHARVCVTDHA